MTMALLSLALSRLVPLLFGAAAVLVAGRVAYDRLAVRHPRAARAAFAGILFAGALAGVPFVRRAVALYGAEAAFDRSDWTVAADRYAEYARLRNSGQGRAGARRALALMNLGRFADAERAFVESFPRSRTGTVRATPNDVLSLGLCRYYQGRLDAAEKTLRAVSPRVSPLRDYALGRILERRGDAGAAADAFRSSLAQAPCFYPSVYQLVRTLRLAGRSDEARTAAETFCPGAAPGDPRRSALLSSGEAPPEKEFLFVQEE